MPRTTTPPPAAPAPVTAFDVRLALLEALEALPVQHRTSLRHALHLFDQYADRHAAQEGRPS